MKSSIGETLRALPGPILVTGHTGFKGTWLTFLVEHFGVAIIGYSLPPEKDSLYDRAKLTSKIPEIFADIRDVETFRKFLVTHKPSIIIHMAAQPLVLKSYKAPRETFDVNVMGTVNVLEEAFATDYVQAVIVVTTDKVYRNDNSGRAFVESDPLEGKDPYSASKVGAEAVVSAWQQIKKVSGGPSVVSVRAGNVIGGGDWAEDRLIPDLVRGYISGKPVEIRNPTSTRPWQHVLDPLFGYLLAIESGLQGKFQKSYNFGPTAESLPVSEVLRIFKESIGANTVVIEDIGIRSLESITLGLSPELAVNELSWKPCYAQAKAIEDTFAWWKRVLNGDSSPLEAVKLDIGNFFSVS